MSNNLHETRNAINDGFVKLLAGENLLVIRHAGKSAYFNLVDRTVHVPNWDFVSLKCPEAEDVMNAHEVFHAMYTPSTHTVNVCRNILEDNRIERLGKQKYPGIRKTFIAGYTQLHETLDFFGIKNIPISVLNTYGFLDRLNLVSKLGSRLGIEFTEEEKVFVDRANNTQTFDDILTLEEDLKEFLKESEKAITNTHVNYSSKEPSDEYSAQSENNLDDVKDRKKPDTNDDDENDVTSNDRMLSAHNSTDENDQFEFESKTIDHFDKLTESLIDVNKKVINCVIGSLNQKFLDKMDTVTIDELQKKSVKAKEIKDTQIIADHRQFKTMYAAAQKGAAVLYKEFMLRKNAKERKFDKVENTGKLDMNRVHMYKLTDSIFKTKTTLYTGENHGFVFLIDVSGSMSGNTIRSTIQQMLLTVEFCRKMSIKYKVYLYSSGVPKECHTEKEFDVGNAGLMTNNMGQQFFTPALIHVLDYTQNMSKHRESAEALYNTIAYSPWDVIRSNSLHYEDITIFAGTSTTSALMTLEKDAKDFFEKNKIEKRNIVLMTDGVSGDRFSPTDSFYKSLTSYAKMNMKHVFHDAVTKRSYTIAHEAEDHSAIALNMLKHRLNANTIFIRLAASVKDAESAQIINKAFFTGNAAYAPNREVKIKELQSKLVKNKFISSDAHPYIDSVFVVKMDKTIEEIDFGEITEDVATKSAKQVANKLIGATKSERTSRVLMQSLAEAFN